MTTTCAIHFARSERGHAGGDGFGMSTTLLPPCNRKYARIMTIKLSVTLGALGPPPATHLAQACLFQTGTKPRSASTVRVGEPRLLRAVHKTWKVLSYQGRVVATHCNRGMKKSGGTGTHSVPR